MSLELHENPHFAEIEDSVCSIFDEVIENPNDTNVKQAMAKCKHLSQSLLKDYSHEEWYAFMKFSRFNKLMTEAFELHGLRPRKFRKALTPTWLDYDVPGCEKPKSVRELLENTVPHLLYILQQWLDKSHYEYAGFELWERERLRTRVIKTVEQTIKTVEQALKLDVPWNYYQVLKVHQDASDQDINRAYKKLALLWHPDKYKQDSEISERVCQECFKLIGEAYQTLKNKSGREQYNTKIANGYKHPEWTTNGQYRFKTMDLTLAFLVFEKAFNNPYLCKFY